LAGDAGLGAAEASARLVKFGPNRLRDQQERPLLLQFLSRFRNPLVVLLLVASAISALTGDVTNFLLMVLFSVTLDFVQERRAGTAAAGLRQSVAITSLAVAAIGAALPFTPVGNYFGFQPLPVNFYVLLAGMVMIYLMAVEVAKRAFYRWRREHPRGDWPAADGGAAP
jgi:magnesium-transporting ATPase (P-type)